MKSRTILTRACMLFTVLIMTGCATWSPEDTVQWDPQSIASPSPVPPETVIAAPTGVPSATLSAAPEQTSTPEFTPTPAIALTSIASNPELPGYIDLVGFGTALEGDVLTAVFAVRELPISLDVNRAGVPVNGAEYSWCAIIFLDGHDDGSANADVQMCVMRFVQGEGGRRSQASWKSGQFQSNLWRNTGSSWTVAGPVTLEVDFASGTITLTGAVPGITADARVLFEASDYLKGKSRSP